MPYAKVLLPENTPSHVVQLVRHQIDPVLAEVHAMFRLPSRAAHGLDINCTISPALTLLNLVGGVAAKIYESPTLDVTQQPGARFEGLLTEFFPWSFESELDGAITGKHAAHLLYEAFRNPLTHSLGVMETESLGNLKIAKGRISEKELKEIETFTTRPNFTVPTLYTDSTRKADRTRTVLLLKAFYWGFRKMLFDMIQHQAVLLYVSAGIPQRIESTATNVSTFDRIVHSVTPGSTDAVMYPKPKK